MLAVYSALTMEVMGDIVASSEASREPIDGLLLDSRIAGGILADGFNGLLSALFTNAPLSIFAQNNGGLLHIRKRRREQAESSARSH